MEFALVLAKNLTALATSVVNAMRSNLIAALNYTGHNQGIISPSLKSMGKMPSAAIRALSNGL